MQRPFQLVPELPTSQPPAQASTYQWVQGAAPQAYMESGGQILTVYNPPGHYGNVIGVSEDTHRAVIPQDIAATCHPMYQVAVHPEHPASNYMHQSFPGGRSACYYPSTTFVQQAPYESIPPIQMSGQVQYPGLTQIYLISPFPYQYIRHNRPFQPPQYVQQPVPIIQQVAPCHIYPTGSNWANVVPQLTESTHQPRASQWAGPSPLPALQTLQQQQTLIHGTTTTQSKKGLNSHPGLCHVLPPECSQQVTKCSEGKNKASRVSPVITPDPDMNVSGSVFPHTTTLVDTTLYFRWESTQAECPEKDTTCASMLATLNCADNPAESCDTLQQRDKTQSLVPSEDISKDLNVIVNTNIDITPSKQTNQDNAQWQLRDRHFGPESLPKELTSCTYDDPLVSALVSSMDHFYSVSTYDVLPSEEETGSYLPLTSETLCRTSNEDTSYLTNPMKRNMPLLESQNPKRKKCYIPKI